jgi:hypothetical protein
MNPTIPYTPISDACINEIRQFATRANACVHLLRRVPVEQDMRWQKMIDYSAPGTRQSSFIRKVGHKFPVTSGHKEEFDIILFGYLEIGRYDRWDDMISWGREAKLQACNPREVFAISQYNPTLNLTIGQKEIGIYSPSRISFWGRNLACVLWYHRSHSDEAMDCTGTLCSRNVPGNAHVWFAFREPPTPVL